MCIRCLNRRCPQCTNSHQILQLTINTSLLLAFKMLQPAIVRARLVKIGNISRPRTAGPAQCGEKAWCGPLHKAWRLVESVTCTRLTTSLSTSFHSSLKFGHLDALCAQPRVLSNPTPDIALQRYSYPYLPTRESFEVVRYAVTPDEWKACAPEYGLQSVL